MIKSLRLANFRRHADLELRFDETGQIILIAGSNGTGKTTILEAIIYALYGEGRHGRRNLDSLLRRGAELEGMEVEMVFTVGEDSYRVLRRRDGRASTAVLYANDHPLVEGQREVSEEVTRVLGMDAAGFRVATIAQQKDLDGLASLTPSVRGRMVSRLLRLDSLTRARDAAGELHLEEAKIAAHLRPTEDISEVSKRVQDTASQMKDAELELIRAITASEQANSQLREAEPIILAWEQQQGTLNVRAAEFAVAEADAERISTDLAAVEVPDASSGANEDLSILTTEVALLERELADAESAATMMEHRRMISAELDAVTVALAENTKYEKATILENAKVARQNATEARSRVEHLDESLRQAREDLSSISFQIDAFSQKIAQNEALEAVCDSCGQEITEEHRYSQSSQYSSKLSELTMLYQPRKEHVFELNTSLSSARDQLEAADIAVAAAATALTNADKEEAERTDLLRRQATYQSQLDRLPERIFDLNALYARKAELALRVAATQDLTERERIRTERLAQRSQLQSSLETAKARTLSAKAALTEAEPSEDLIASYSQILLLKETLSSELELAQYWRTEHAVASERLVAAQNSMTRANSEADRRKLHQDRAYDAGNAKRLLTDVADRLATTVRPSLEGAVTHLLQSMSEGRFNKVRISEEYEITVDDDGAFRSVGELSGGEADLVALAMRLALAQIVADRHGSGGAGFLILDEPLGSQDPTRRAAILRGLRAIRDTYSQIFLISHVDGIEDSADAVVNVIASEDRSETLVEIS
jgi:exonuclease SbcC